MVINPFLSNLLYRNRAMKAKYMKIIWIIAIFSKVSGQWLASLLKNNFPPQLFFTFCHFGPMGLYKCFLHVLPLWINGPPQVFFTCFATLDQWTGFYVFNGTTQWRLMNWVKNRAKHGYSLYLKSFYSTFATFNTSRTAAINHRFLKEKTFSSFGWI